MDMRMMSPDHGTEKEPLVGSRSGRVWTMSLVLSIACAIIGNSLQFGFQTSCMANTQTLLNEKFHVSDVTMSTMVSGIAMGGLVGGLSAGLIADRVGRKMCMALNNIPMLIGTVLMALSFNEYFFIFGRIIAGFAVGVASGIAPMYISEISPVSVKGGVGVSHQFMITLGILIAFVLSIKDVLPADPDKAWTWHLYFAFPVLPALFQLLILPFCPESPNWLYYNREREDLARQALTKLRDSRETAEEEMEAMIKERTTGKETVMVTYGQFLTNPTLRLSLLIGVVLQCAQQLSGINAILNYAPAIFKDAGESNADLATISVGAIFNLMTFVSVPLMDKLGRRTLMLAGLAMMVVSYVGVGVSQYYHHIAGEGEYNWTSPVAILTLITFVISFAIGPGSIPWLIVGEIFTAEARGKASSVCVGVNWVCNLIVCFTYDKLNAAIQPYTFFFYMGIVVISFIFTLLFVPETRQKPVDQINREISEQALKCPPTVF